MPNKQADTLLGPFLFKSEETAMASSDVPITSLPAMNRDAEAI